DDWKAANITNDRVKCNKVDKVVANEGNCAYMFRGSVGENAKLTQKNKDVAELTAGSTLNVVLFYRTSNVQPTVQVRLTVYYDDATTTKLDSVINTVSSEYTPFNVARYLVENGKTVTKIRLQIQNRSTDGKVFIDSPAVNAFASPTVSISPPELKPLLAAPVIAPIAVP
ncbi:MAG TPA: hypothetical protein VHL11_06790, partial [Phototrophicaceae bacterium]|nr:hypothetical protein [Phototrophicaceae bacterium]